MLKPLFDSSTISLLEKVAIFGERRQQVLAGNNANIDSPNYKTRDLPVEAFQQALKAAVAQRQRPSSLGNASLTGSTAAKSLSELFPDELFKASESPPRNITFQDANNRSVEHEVMEMTKNIMMQSFAVELMTAQFNLLQSIISERA